MIMQRMTIDHYIFLQVSKYSKSVEEKDTLQLPMISL